MGPIAIITGVSHGIGAATARLFAAEAYDVCINYVSEHYAAPGVFDNCKTSGARAVAVSGNVGHRHKVEALFDACDEKPLHVSCLINNARCRTCRRRIWNGHFRSTPSARCTAPRLLPAACRQRWVAKGGR